MAYPLSDLGTVTLTCRYFGRIRGDLLGGSVSLKPEAIAVAEDGHDVLLDIPYEAPIDITTGTVTISDLPVSNDPDYPPVVTYLVTERIKTTVGVFGRHQFRILIDASLAGTVYDLASAVPVEPVTAVTAYARLTGATFTGAVSGPSAAFAALTAPGLVSAIRDAGTWAINTTYPLGSIVTRSGARWLASTTIAATAAFSANDGWVSLGSSADSF